MENENEYSSKDFYLSACLLAAGAPLLRLEPQNNNVYLFIFGISNEKAKEIIQGYWTGTLTLPVKKFVEAINELKTRLHNGV